MTPNGVLLYLDEIQYFNKKQQQSLLEYIENGQISLIASTTENPYFSIYSAVLSRSTVFEFKPVEAADVQKAVLRAVGIMEKRLGVTARLEDGVVSYISSSAEETSEKPSIRSRCCFTAQENIMGLCPSEWRIPGLYPKEARCVMTRAETSITTYCRPFRNRSGARIRMPAFIILQGFLKRETCFHPAAAF
jgi:hypothetical protein